MEPMKPYSLETLQGLPKAPVYHRYRWHEEPQPAYICIDGELRMIYVSWDGEVGNAVPAKVWKGVIRRIKIPSDVSSWGLDSLSRDNGFEERLKDFLETWGYDEEYELQRYTSDFLEEHRLTVYRPEEYFEMVSMEMERDATSLSLEEFLFEYGNEEPDVYVEGMDEWLKGFWEERN